MRYRSVDCASNEVLARNSNRGSRQITGACSFDIDGSMRHQTLVSPMNDGTKVAIAIPTDTSVTVVRNQARS